MPSGGEPDFDRERSCKLGELLLEGDFDRDRDRDLEVACCGDKCFSSWDGERDDFLPFEGDLDLLRDFLIELFDGDRDRA